MSLLVTGSIGIDTISTPVGHAENVLGGTAVYFSFAAGHYGPVRLVGVVGDDFPQEFRRVLESRRIDLRGLEVRQGSKTFRWQGRYEGAMNEAQTIGVDLNVLGERGPKVPRVFTDSDCVFLANTHPTLQRELLSQLWAPKLIVADTMDLWITTERDSLVETLKQVHGIILNDGEARQLTGTDNLIKAGGRILNMGPNFVVIKKGEHGALLLSGDKIAAVPAYPTVRVVDPTGAGDSFAGGFMGYLSPMNTTDWDTLRQAMVRGTVAASFAIEGFSLGRVGDLSQDDIEQRIKQYVDMLRFEV